MHPTDPPLIALVNATSAAIAPATSAIQEALPGTTVWSLLDDRLLQDAESAGGITNALAARMDRLLRHAAAEGADGILVTCSIYGGAIGALAEGLSLPVLSADGEAFDAIADGGFDRVLVLSSGRAPLDDSLLRLRAHLDGRGRHDTALVGTLSEEAFTAARSGDVSALADILTREVEEHPDVSAVFLAQYSLSPASARLAAATGLPVYAGPQLAAAALAQRIHKEEHA